MRPRETELQYLDYLIRQKRQTLQRETDTVRRRSLIGEIRALEEEMQAYLPRPVNRRYSQQ